jgi:hypothetical protein
MACNRTARIGSLRVFRREIRHGSREAADDQKKVDIRAGLHYNPQGRSE